MNRKYKSEVLFISVDEAPDHTVWEPELSSIGKSLPAVSLECSNISNHEDEFETKLQGGII